MSKGDVFLKLFFPQLVGPIYMCSKSVIIIKFIELYQIIFYSIFTTLFLVPDKTNCVIHTWLNYFYIWVCFKLFFMLYSYFMNLMRTFKSLGKKFGNGV